jgi:hypothetical protein
MTYKGREAAAAGVSVGRGVKVAKSTEDVAGTITGVAVDRVTSGNGEASAKGV